MVAHLPEKLIVINFVIGHFIQSHARLKVTLNVKIFFILSWFGTVRIESEPMPTITRALSPPSGYVKNREQGMKVK